MRNIVGTVKCIHGVHCANEGTRLMQGVVLSICSYERSSLFQKVGRR